LDEHEIYWAIRDANTLEEKRKAAKQLSDKFNAELVKAKIRPKRRTKRQLSQKS